MRRGLIIIALAILIGFVIMMITYTVDFTQKAVVTTFGKAGENAVVETPGLKWKLPSPLQSVTVYDTRSRTLDARAETQNTSDGRQIIVESFMVWSVEDPLEFFRKFGSSGSDARAHFRNAETTLSSILRSEMSKQVPRYRFGDLFTSAGSVSKLPELEDAMRDSMQTAASEYGVKVTLAGIKRILLPQNTTKSVFDRMAAQRQKAAGAYENAGRAEAEAIKTAAEKDASRIRAFAETLAAEIRNKGDLEAAQFIAVQNEDPELAVFLAQVRFFREAMAKKVTMVVTPDMLGWGLLNLKTRSIGEDGVIPASPSEVPGQ
ncbi:MAG: hypothetical protein H6812_05330 [Phycisphaeraceae bacterium]|nr:hypothetical protein [Phycisphaerales bacterium]MCB9842663.1 hypothetical protein [Phycisphaeraceae bacterium]